MTSNVPSQRGVSPAGRRLLTLLQSARVDGHTVVPVAVAEALLRGVRLRLADALADVGPDGTQAVCEPTAELLGLSDLVAAEQEIARRVAEFAAAGRLHVMTGPAGVPRNAAIGSLAGTAAVADDAEFLDVGALAAFFAGCSADETVVLAGDPAGLGSPGAGRGFADIAESGLATVGRVDADAEATGPALRAFAASIAAGQVPQHADPSHEVVVVPAATASEAVHRTRQLVGDSIPRAFSIPPGDVQVLAVTREGLDAVAALALPAGTPTPMLVHDCLGHRFAAVVLVITTESAGLLTRPLIYSAVSSAGRHISIVNAAGRALADAVRQPPVPRRTLLRRLLAGYSSSGSHSRSSSSSSMSSSSSVVSTGPNGVTSSYAANSTSS